MVNKYPSESIGKQSMGIRRELERDGVHAPEGRSKSTLVNVELVPAKSQ